MVAHRGELLDGTLSYSRIPGLKVDEQYEFTIRLSGLEYAGTPSPTPRPGDGRRQATIGGSVGARLSCTGIACTAISSERQNVLTATDHAEWTWRLSAHKAGTAHVTLVMTTYDQDTANVLTEAPPIEQRISVSPTPAYAIKRIAGWTKGFIVLVGASAFGGIATALWRWLRKHRSGTVRKTEARPGIRHALTRALDRVSK